MGLVTNENCEPATYNGKKSKAQCIVLEKIDRKT